MDESLNMQTVTESLAAYSTEFGLSVLGASATRTCTRKLDGEESRLYRHGDERILCQ
jgi:hypothetical protein